MSDTREGGDAQNGVPHEPIASETLKEHATRTPETDFRTQEPLKHHGDALAHGTGTRHGEAPDGAGDDEQGEGVND